MLIFDIETDGLLDTVSRLFCLSIYDTDKKSLIGLGPDKAESGVRLLQKTLDEGGSICGHNIINYDIPALEKLYPWFHVSYAQQKQVVDTLVLARLVYSHIEVIDLGLMNGKVLPRKLYKSHSLKAWGYRLRELKGEYGEQEEAWACYNPEMLEYNKQDVVVTNKLYEKLTRNPYSKKAIDLEHEVAWLMAKQERNGFPFAVDDAAALEVTLRSRNAILEAKLVKLIPRVPDKVFIPKRDNKAKGYKKGVPIQKYKDFNPNSRKQIEYVIRNLYHYSPDCEDLYDIPDDAENINFNDYRLKIDEETFKFIKDDNKAPDIIKNIAGILEESLMLGKRLGQLADGRHGWLKEYKADGRMHGRVITNGCVSGRASHASPNVAQVPAVNSPYGKECRALFNAGEGRWQAGIDASGLELRCLAHYMFPYDDGEYAHEILNGDIHTKNQMAAGLPTRNNAKTFIYGFLYGAGDAKIGKIIGADAKEGKRIKKKFLKATPAIKSLRAAVQGCLADTKRGKVSYWKRRYLKGLDGRLLHVRSLHSALNLLLQSAGAIVCKKWIVRTEERLLNLGFTHSFDGDFAYMAWVHDEIQISCKTKEIAEIVVREAQEAMRDTQAFFNFRVQLDTEGKIGKNWGDCH